MLSFGNRPLLESMGVLVTQRFRTNQTTHAGNIMNNKTLPTTETGRSMFDGIGTSKLIKSLVVLKLSSFEPLALNSEKLFHASQRVLGRRLTELMLRHTFYEHFVAGESEADLRQAVENLYRRSRVNTMLLPPMEDLHGQSENFEAQARRSADRYLLYLDMASRLNEHMPGHKAAMQYKLSAVFPTQSLNHISQTCGNSYDHLLALTESYANIMQGSVGWDTKNEHDTSMFRGLQLSAEIFTKANHLGIPIVIDAELRGSRLAMHAVSMAAMALHNSISQQHTPVYTTFQCYFKDTLEVLKQCLQVSNTLGYRLGAKCVRGAYITAERLIAASSGEADTICANFDATSASYNRVISHLLHAHDHNAGAQALIVASHNMQSIQAALQMMHELKISPNDAMINFAQTRGFCEQIANELGTNGYNVYKSVPWGTVDEWVPYLARRAMENHTALRAARNECPAYVTEIRKRFGNV